MVLAVEVGGQWSSEAWVSCVSWPGRRPDTRHVSFASGSGRRAGRDFALFGCAVTPAFAVSVLELRSSVGADGAVPPLREVEGDHRHSSLVAG